MSSSNFFPILFVITSSTASEAWSGSYPTLMTTAPAHLQRSAVDSVIGTYITSNSYGVITCNGGKTPVRISNYCLCSDPYASSTLDNYPVTSCSDATLYYSNTSEPCGGDYTCLTLNLLQTQGDTDTTTLIDCDDEDLPSTIYRNPPKITQDTSTTTSSESTSTTTNPSSTTTAPPKPSSQAWIAGPVIGSIVGAALIGALAWWILRRKRQQKTALNSDSPHSRGDGPFPTTSSPPPMSQSSPAQSYAYTHSQSFSENRKEPYYPPQQFPATIENAPPPTSQYSIQNQSPTSWPGSSCQQQTQWRPPDPSHELPATKEEIVSELGNNPRGVRGP
ncbi:hypothetical protein V2G26_005689 [Clonostachys chloroleuca]